jgi:peptidoglycan/LPS O-acetylase OafA/YrhL
LKLKVSQLREGLTNRAGYYPALDAASFVLAFWVAVGHFEMIPLFGDLNSGAGLWNLFKRGWNTAVFGTPTVIVFFVISGFCIHLPFLGSTKIDVARYYLRRYTRILIPVARALVFSRLVGMRLIFWGERSVLRESPLWSLAREEIYYPMYPLLRWSRNKLGWKILLPASFALSVPIAATHPHAENWDVFGPFGAAIMLLPVWLLGCLLAEQGEPLTEAKPLFGIWFWRVLAWQAGSRKWRTSSCTSPTRKPWFGVLPYFWVRKEIAHGKTHPPNRLLVAAGAWSYSLYLTHAQGGGLLESLKLPSPGRLPDRFLVMASSLIFAFAFYILIERPSHRLARKIKVRGAWKSAESGESPAESLPGTLAFSEGSARGQGLEPFPNGGNSSII